MPVTRSSIWLALPAALVAAFLTDCGIPGIVAPVTGNRFDAKTYWQVFIHQHHAVAGWFGRGWPQLLMAFAVLLGPFIGGVVLYRLAPAGKDAIRGMAIRFAVAYGALSLVFALLAEVSRPYPFNLGGFIRFQGIVQLITLLLVAGVMCGLGAGWMANRASARNLTPP